MVILVVVVILLGVALYLGRPAPPTTQHYGITFSSQQASDLGLDPKAAYLSLLDDLGVRQLRLGAYWNEIEPSAGKYDFSQLDWQLEEASKRNATVILTVGRKAPRWPECFEPDWAKEMTETEAEDQQVAMVQNVVSHYWNDPTITMWQLENEPFVGWFGVCPPPNPKLLQRELDVIRSISNKPVLITDSGELSIWNQAARFGDVFGTTMYTITWNQYWGYSHLPIPALYYRLRARLWGRQPKDVLVMELQAEPWSPATPLATTPIEEQMKSMNMTQFQHNVQLAHDTGFGDVYLWGAEWWIWMKDHGHPEFWDYAKNLVSKP